MTGVVLKQLGHHVRIFERHPSTHMEGQGAGITAQSDVQQLLANCGLLEPPFSVKSPNLQIFSRDGSVKSKWNFIWQMTSWNTLYFRLRAAFDGYRSEYCPEPQQTGSGEGIYEHGKLVTDVKSSDHGVTIYFDDLIHSHSSTTADLLIAADGMQDFFVQESVHGGSENQFNSLSVRIVASLELNLMHCDLETES